MARTASTVAAITSHRQIDLFNRAGHVITCGPYYQLISTGNASCLSVLMSEPPSMPEWGWNGVFVFMGALVGAAASGAVAWWLEKRRLEWQSTDARRRIAAGLDAELELLVVGVQASLRCDDALATMTTVATFRPLMTVFSANADQLGHLEPELARATIGAYHSIHHLIDRGHEMWQEAERVGYDVRRRASSLADLREGAEEYVPRLQRWLEEAADLRRQLGEVVD